MTDAKHQTFRTLTALLRAIQTAVEKTGPSSPVMQLTEDDQRPGLRDHLRSVAALATVLVRNHEVVAVATNVSDDNWDHGECSNLAYFVTLNPRRCKTSSDPTDTMTYNGSGPFPIISQANSSDISDLGLMSYLKQTW
jgi:hypothetical protein